MPSLEERLAGVTPSLSAAATGAPPPVADPVALLRHLEGSGRFHRDTGLGRIFHPGSVSFRENVPNNSLHVVIRGNHIAAHVDLVSPLGVTTRKPSHYSIRRAVLHNALGVAQDLLRLLRGRQGDHRSQLDCQWFDDGAPPSEAAIAGGSPRVGAWSVHLEVRLPGRLDPDRLATALAEVCQGASDGGPVPVVACPDPAALDRARQDLLARAVPADRCPPVAVVLARRPPEDDGGEPADTLLVNLNHAACDGPGALQLLSSLANRYAGRPTAPAHVFLSLQDLPVRPGAAWTSRWVGLYRTVVEWARDLLTRPHVLAADGAESDEGYGFHLRSLTRDETDRVVDPRRPGTSRNLLLTALHLAAGDWNRQHGSPGGRIGVLVPADLRPDTWAREPIANFSVTARVSTSRRHRAEPARALLAVAAQKTRNRRTRTGTALLDALNRAGMLALWAKQSQIVLHPATHNRLVDTAMLADLGWVDDLATFGDVGAPEAVWFSLPARTPRCLCVGTVVVDGRLHVTLRYPHRVFSAGAAARFADVLVRRLLDVAAVAPWTARPPASPEPDPGPPVAPMAH